MDVLRRIGALLASALDEFRRAGLATGRADRETAGRGVALAYRAAGLDPPRRLVWLESPLLGTVGAGLVGQCRASVHEAVVARPFRSAWHDAPARLTVDVRRLVELALRDRCLERIRTLLREEIQEQATEKLVPAVAQSLAAQGARELAGPGSCVDPTGLPPRCHHGQFDSSRLGLLEFWGRLGADVTAARGLLALSKACGWWWPFDGVCVLTERPVTLEIDGEARLHSTAGPAIGFADGWGITAWQGVRIPASLLGAPEDFDIEKLLRIPNAEVRRRLVRRVGAERIMRSPRATVIHRESDRVLLRVHVPGDEPIVTVMVTCPSTGHSYFLRVPPWIRTCREAVAWTFRVPERDYRPFVET